MNGTLGKLTRVDVRKVFADEAGDFTPWLARDENLLALAEAIGIDLQLEAQEKEVGPFRADILCKDSASDAWVLIENQLEKTDHIHLGQLLTYAAGLEAVTIIWIANRFTDEHRAALDWLNQQTTESINFFGIEIELWHIADSPIAPKFNIVCQPNDWRSSIRASAAASAANSEAKQTQLRFWTAFREYMESTGSQVRCQKPRPQHWMSHRIGASTTWLHSIASFWDSETNAKGPELRVELSLGGPNANANFAKLENMRAEIEHAISTPLIWHNPENKNACRIYVRQGADFSNPANWPAQHKWLKDKLELFKKVFAPLAANLP